MTLWETYSERKLEQNPQTAKNLSLACYLNERRDGSLSKGQVAKLYNPP